MENTIIKIDDIIIPKQKFHQHRRPISIENGEIDKIVVSEKVGYKNAEKSKHLCVFLPKKTTYRKYFDEIEYVSFLIKDDKLLEKYNEIWNNVNYTIRKEFGSNLAYNKRNLRDKTKSYKGKTNANFHNNKMPKEDSHFICLLVILIDFVFETSKNYYPLIFLEECKYVRKKKKKKLRKKRFMIKLLMM